MKNYKKTGHDEHPDQLSRHRLKSTRESNLGSYMRSFLTSFTSRHNHRHNSCGHVFQGRYKAYLIEDAKAYVAKVTQYIHLNPVRIGSLEDAPLDVRHQTALDCKWSSYGQIMQLSEESTAPPPQPRR